MPYAGQEARPRFAEAHSQFLGASAQVGTLPRQPIPLQQSFNSRQDGPMVGNTQLGVVNDLQEVGHARGDNTAAVPTTARARPQ